MRDRARAEGDAGISAARPTRPMNWRATSRADHSGFEGVADAVHGSLEPVLHDPIQPPGHERPDHEGRRHVGDPELDANAIRRLRERETALLLDQSRL